MSDNTAPSWQATVVALGFLALIGVMFWRATDGDFATIWAGVGTVVGVATGAIPGYFFARSANAQAAKTTAQVNALLTVSSLETVKQAHDLNQKAFA